MWLLPLLDRISAFAARTYYDLTVAGDRVPADGPVLLVANHPNSLFDPALVAAAARRPVRFLAKEPLLRDPAIGWLVRGSGAIPVYRAQDDPASVGRNEEAFRAAHEALREGAAIGIFPEGISHDLPALAPLKTGAARIALGAARLLGGSFPIVPVGLTFRGKERFRSEALALVGEPIAWEDLAHAEYGAAEVRELTRRIAVALEAQTLNLASWEDAPLIEAAAAIYAAEFGTGRDPASRAAAEREAVRILVRVRAEGPGAWQDLAREVRRHTRVLRSLGLDPADLHTPEDALTAARWTLRQGGFLVLTGLLGLVGSVLFWVPYRLTGWVVGRMDLTTDIRSTHRTLGGALFFSIWILLLAGVAGVVWRVWVGVGILVALPALALLTVAFRDRWTQARTVARRYLLLRSRREWRQFLRQRQRGIAERLHRLRVQAPARDGSPTAPGLPGGNH
jgi:glycerol-3-phosphate O-acyltransferase / dihydroxyacetone phosphate acyltransferase